MPETFTIVPRGPFSLAEAIAFGFGQRDAAPGDDVMRLAFCLDGYRQQVARVLSLDHDAAGFLRAGERDPVLGALQEAAPGLRPPLFYSPYEAAAWAVLSMRRPPRQMMAVRDRLSRAHGAVFDLAGQQLAALPSPAQLLRIEAFPGIPADRIERLQGVARAAQEGRLDAARLLRLHPEEAMAGLREIPGIGPFYSALIVIRGTGFTDVLPLGEPKLRTLVEQLYNLPAPVSDETLSGLAEAWKPFRTWAAVLIRAAAKRVLGGVSAQPGSRPADRRPVSQP